MRSGIVAVVGRPNVGKSSLVNALVGRKVSIVTTKPQTTRHRIQGVLQRPDAQIVFVDTPGLHMASGHLLNRRLNDVAAGSLEGVDAVLFVTEAGRFRDEDEAVLQRIEAQRAPAGLMLNKVDRLPEKTVLLPEIERLSKRHDFAFVVPGSATRGDNLDRLADELARLLPEGPALYTEGSSAAPNLRFHAAELVREKLMQRLRDELPYALTVETESLEEEGKLLRIACVVWIERAGQKKIVIGEDGAMLKSAGSAVRRELEALTGRKVFLRLWVRVKPGWTDDPADLKRFGYPPP